MELDKIKTDEVQENFIYLRREFFEYINKNSKILSRPTERKEMESMINIVKEKSGKICRMMKEKLKELLEWPIEKAEIAEVIKKLKNWKAPGMDGLGAEYYKVYEKILIPKLIELYNGMITREMHRGINH